MKKFMLAILVCLLVSSVALGFARDFGTPIRHLVAPGGESLAITAYNKELVWTSATYDVDIQVLTPEFGKKRPDHAPTGQGDFIGFLLVRNDKIVDMGVVRNNLPNIPDDGMLVIGYGVGWLHFLSKVFEVGDPVAIKEVKPGTPKTLPTVVIAPDGSVFEISGWNRVRRANEIIIYTRDYGSHTFTNEWGRELAVEDDEVIEIRPMAKTTLLEIPYDGYVISGHGEGASRLNNIKEWDFVELE